MNRQVECVLAIFISLPSCASGPSSGQTDQTVSPVTSQPTGEARVPRAADSCEALEEAACSSASDCYAVAGSRLEQDGGASCFGTHGFVSCRKTPEGCGDGISYACDESGAVYRFGDTCTPTAPGWRECPNTAALDELPSCRPPTPPVDLNRAHCEEQCKDEPTRDGLGGNSAPSARELCLKRCLSR